MTCAHVRYSSNSHVVYTHVGRKANRPDTTITKTTKNDITEHI
jgi:hypothetical protein